MLDIVVQVIFEGVGYGTGEVILRCFPRTWVRTERTQQAKWSRKLVRGRRRKNGKYQFQEHNKKIEEIEPQQEYTRASDGALVLGTNAVMLLGFLVWLFIGIILAVGYHFWAGA
jgi:hypothetical protein